MTKIYEIWHDTKDYGDEDYDGVFRGDVHSIPYSSTELSQQIFSKAPRVVPESLDHDTDNVERLKSVNIVQHSAGPTDIFSTNLINVIESIGSVEWTLIPARFFDNATKKEVCEGRFSAVFFEYFIDCFDYEQSEYRRLFPNNSLERRRKLVAGVNKLVLKEPDTGFPPYFRLLADPSKSLINAETHDAIVKANIHGIKMRLIGDF